MKQVSFLHMADLHLDAAFSSLGDDNKAQLRRNELEKCLEGIIEKVQIDNVDMLIISGDFFDSSYVRGLTLLKVKNLFSELYQTEIIICPGNHDSLGNSSYYNEPEWGGNVHILKDTEQVLYLEKYNTCIYNLGVRGNSKKDYLKLSETNIPNDRFNMLVFHGTVDMPFEDDNYNSISSRELLSLNMDYVALGHIHCHSRYQSGQTLMINPGSPEPLGFDEEGEHGYVQGRMFWEDNRKKTTAVFIQSAFRHYYNLEVNISGCSNDTEVIERISAAEGKRLKESDLYSIVLRGFIPRKYTPDIKRILDAFKQNCFFVKIKNQTSVQFEYEHYLEDPGIKGEYVRRIIDMWDSESSDEKRETLMIALQYGLQALENGRVD